MVFQDCRKPQIHDWRANCRAKRRRRNVWANSSSYCKTSAFVTEAHSRNTKSWPYSAFFFFLAVRSDMQNLWNIRVWSGLQHTQLPQKRIRCFEAAIIQSVTMIPAAAAFISVDWGQLDVHKLNQDMYFIKFPTDANTLLTSLWRPMARNAAINANTHFISRTGMHFKHCDSGAAETPAVVGY